MQKPASVTVQDTRRWHLFYVGYRSAPMNGSHAYVQFGGVIVHAVSSVPGPGGLGGPYEAKIGYSFDGSW